MQSEARKGMDKACTSIKSRILCYLSRTVEYSDFICRPGNREKLRNSQAELGPAIRSAVSYFADISGGATGLRDL